MKKYLIVLFFLLSIFLIMTEPLIDLKGRNEIILNLNDKYVEQGYSGKTRTKELTKQVKVENNINNKKIGDYEVKYQLKNLFNTKTVVRKIHVVDNQKPNIILKGKTEIEMCPNDNYEEEGYEASDNYDKDLKSKVKIVKTNDQIIYKVKDSSGNEDIKIRKIISKDKEAPNLKLEGEEVVILKKGEKFNDPGYQAIDDCDNDISANVLKMGSVDSNKEGLYKLTYVVKDKTGKETRKYRDVFVTNHNNYNGGIIYLTFDDGPSEDVTPFILDILKEEKIRATFFVTDKKEELNYLIKREQKEGHTVALHTATHNYSYLYSSPEAYFEDLKTVSEKVKRITKKEAKIIRFPGGSSNTVSKKYYPGIMTYLTSEVSLRGYKYYDWNIDSEDATRRVDENKVYENVVSHLKPNRENIILMHDFSANEPTKNALRRIIQYGKENGYIFAPITENTNEIHHHINN